MTEFIVHIHRHCGWYTTTAEGQTFGEAAINAVIATTHKFTSYDMLGSVPHRVEYHDDGERQSVCFYETSIRPVFRGMQYPGDLWFADTVRQGEHDDCPACGGTGRNHYNPFRQCWECGDKTLESPSSGKRRLDPTAHKDTSI